MSHRSGKYGAWRMIDRHRNREKLTQHQLDFVLAAIEQVHGRRSINGSPMYEFSDESALRGKHVPR